MGCFPNFELKFALKGRKTVFPSFLWHYDVCSYCWHFNLLICCFWWSIHFKAEQILNIDDLRFLLKKFVEKILNFTILCKIFFSILTIELWKREIFQDFLNFKFMTAILYFWSIFRKHFWKFSTNTQFCCLNLKMSNNKIPKRCMSLIYFFFEYGSFFKTY